MSIDFKNDDDFLNFLMTTEFADSLTSNDMSNCLTKFKQFMRTAHSNVTRMDLINDKLESLNKHLADENEKLVNENKKLINKIALNKDRKLSIKERIVGVVKDNIYIREFKIVNYIKLKLNK